jgi:tetratricopeptide (TPR) repeat protein
MAEVAGLVRLVQRYAAPDQPGLEGETTARLEQFARNPDPDVQALALGLLHLSRGSDPTVRRFLTRELRDLGTNESLVRDRWAWILKARGDAYLKAGDYLSAIQTYQKGTEVKPRDPSGFRNLGVGYTRLRDYDHAVEYLKRSLEIDRRQPQALIDLGFALMQRGDLGAADSAYRRAIEISPYEPAAYANLGVINLRRRELSAAIEALEKAVALDPSLADASFFLANAYAAQNRFADALRAVKQGLEFDPRNPQAQRLLEDLERRVPR